MMQHNANIIKKYLAKKNNSRGIIMKQFNLEEYLKNPSMRIVTMDGREVKILCTNYYLANQCVIAEVVDIGLSFSFNQYGVQYGTTGDSPLNLFFAPEKHEGWVNIFKVNNFYHTEDELVYNSKKEAEIQGKNYMSYIDTIKIEWEE